MAGPRGAPGYAGAPACPVRWTAKRGSMRPVDKALTESLVQTRIRFFEDRAGPIRAGRARQPRPGPDTWTRAPAGRHASRLIDDLPRPPDADALRLRAPLGARSAGARDGWNLSPGMRARGEFGCSGRSAAPSNGASTIWTATRDSHEPPREHVDLDAGAEAGRASLLLLSGGLILGLAMGSRHVQGLFMLPMLGDRGWGREGFAFAIGVQALVWGVLQPVTGLIADRFGTSRVIAGGCLVYARGLAIEAMAPSQGWLTDRRGRRRRRRPDRDHLRDRLRRPRAADCRSSVAAGPRAWPAASADSSSSCCVLLDAMGASVPWAGRGPSRSWPSSWR